MRLYLVLDRYPDPENYGSEIEIIHAIATTQERADAIMDEHHHRYPGTSAIIEIEESDTYRSEPIRHDA